MSAGAGCDQLSGGNSRAAAVAVRAESSTTPASVSTLRPPLPLMFDVKLACPGPPSTESVKPLVLIVWPMVMSEPVPPVSTLLSPSRVTGMLKVVVPDEALPSIAPLSSMALPLAE